MLQITILGCGSSVGVPVIGCDCSICHSSLSYNKRTRSAIYIDNGESRVLIDFGFDIKDQLIRENIRILDGVILSHDHADHTCGIDDLRIFPYIQKQPLEIFTDKVSAQAIKNRYSYLFTANNLIARPMDFFANFKIKTLNVQFFRQNHGAIDSLGIRVDDFVYSSDVSDFPGQSKTFLKNVKVWIVDCMSYTSTAAHSGLDKVLEWNEEYRPEQILLTNMNHHVDYHEISKKLPSNIKPLYDGYKFVV